MCKYADLDKGQCFITYQVCFERRGKLYIDVNGVIEIIQNPYDFTPLYVKMNKLKSGVWKIKSAK